MSRWLDLALIGDEAQLMAEISALDADQQHEALSSLADALSTTEDRLVVGLIRLLVERVRPLALPTELWSRSNTSSDDPRDIIRRHFARKGITATPARVTAAANLYNRFLDERGKTSVGLADLKAGGFRCGHCGMAFCNDQLENKGIVSPFGNRRRDKRDPHKPHWNGEARFRWPTHDHVWPVSTFGDNATANLKVLCRGCNHGKENVLALQQVKAWTGLIGRPALLENTVVDWVHFYAQLRDEPICANTGLDASQTELTVEVIDVDALPVFGNLRTIESPGI